MDLATLVSKIVGHIATTWKEHPGDLDISKGAKEGGGYGPGQGGGPPPGWKPVPKSAKISVAAHKRYPLLKIGLSQHHISAMTKAKYSKNQDPEF